MWIWWNGSTWSNRRYSDISAQPSLCRPIHTSYGSAGGVGGSPSGVGANSCGFFSAYQETDLNGGDYDKGAREYRQPKSVGGDYRRPPLLAQLDRRHL
jgi:hypothetical protein